jgi:Na+/H+-dicarboxylate symporter
MVPSNIVTALGTDNFLGVICFASVFAIDCFKTTNRPKAILDLFLEIKNFFMKLIEFIIKLTPFAVASLVAGALASQNDLNKAFLNIG